MIFGIVFTKLNLKKKCNLIGIVALYNFEFFIKYIDFAAPLVNTLE